MVKVREDQPIRPDGSIDLDAWIERFSQDVNLRDVDQVREACEFVAAKEAENEHLGSFWSAEVSCLQVGLEMAQILAELKSDQETVLSGILYRAVRENKIPLAEVRERYGETVAKLIKSTQGMAAISQRTHPGRGQVLGQDQDQVDKVRKMLVSIIDDVRVALIKLAERTCAIREAKHQSKERQLRVAREVFDIYAPLAHRLGIGYIKWELEDLSFRYLKASDYKKIARLLNEKRLERQQFIDEVIMRLKQALKEASIKAEVFGRAKHIYSIWRKMRRKNADFREIYDIRAFRILVENERDCYGVLGIVHSLWKHIPKEFDDYIATPKENGYRSLHTAVIGPFGKTMEVQIRTRDMHEESELGVCAHWKYKGTDVNNKQDSYEEKLSWLRQVMEWHEELGDLEGLGEHWRADVEPDRIYVFTKDGHVVDLPVSATPLDFAYRIHTEVGNTCRGAKVGDRIVPLNHTLRTGDQVEILTGPGARPSRDWLNPYLGYVMTSRAKAKIAHWFKTQDRDENIHSGRTLIEAELKRLDLREADLEQVAQQLNHRNAEDMFASIGAGDLRPTQVIHAAQRLLEPERRPDEIVARAPKADSKPVEGAINILGVGNLMTQMANCCQPLPGDPIIGYITVGRGVSVHRRDCTNMLQLQEQEPARVIAVSWGQKNEDTYPVDVLIEAYDRGGLLRDITSVLHNEKINVTAVQSRSNREEHLCYISLTIEIPGLAKLGRVLGRISQLPNVIDARRSRKGAMA